MKHFVRFSLASFSICFLVGILAFCANSQPSSEGSPSASVPQTDLPVPEQPKGKEISYAEKDRSKEFREFLSVPAPAKETIVKRGLETYEQNPDVLTDEKLFAQVWNNLNEEEKQSLLQEKESVELVLHNVLEFAADSPDLAY